jgi:hypothetical protein
VCKSLDKNTVTHSVLIGSKSVRNGGALILPKNKKQNQKPWQGRGFWRGAQFRLFFANIIPWFVFIHAIMFVHKFAMALAFSSICCLKSCVDVSLIHSISIPVCSVARFADLRKDVDR